MAEYDKRGRSDLLYYEVSRLTRTEKKVTVKTAAITDEDREYRWKQVSKEEMEGIH